MNIKNVLIFLSGVVVGSGSTFLIVRKIMNNRSEKKVEDRINEELSKLYPPKKEPEKKKEPPVVAATERDTSIYGVVDEIKRREYSSPGIANEKEVTMQDTVVEEVKEATARATKTSKPKTPKRVTLEEFEATSEEKRMTLYYYADNVLADDDDVRYDDVEIMGASNLKTFKKTYDNMYIFNPITGIVYEIMSNNHTYADIVGGDDRLI